MYRLKFILETEITIIIFNCRKNYKTFNNTPQLQIQLQT